MLNFNKSIFKISSHFSKFIPITTYYKFGTLLKEPKDPANITEMKIKIGDYAE